MKTQKIIIFILSVLLVGACVVAVHYYKAYTAAVQNTPEAAAAQTQAIVAKVGQLIVLPQGETPTIATIVDPSALQGQSFFENAKKGDIVLVYANAKKAILYDPTMNKIVEVAPVTNNAPTPTPATTTTSGASHK